MPPASAKKFCQYNEAAHTAMRLATISNNGCNATGMVLFRRLRSIRKIVVRMKETGSLIIAGICLVLAGNASLARHTKEPKPAVPDVNAAAASALRELYQKQAAQLLWYCNSCEAKRIALLDYIRHSDTLGLEPDHYLDGPDSAFPRNPKADSISLQKADRELSKIALRFSYDLYAGADHSRLLSYDEVSPRYAEADMSFLARSLAQASDAPDLINMLSGLQPKTKRYQSLKKELQHLPVSGQKKRRALLAAMSYCRWIHHFSFDRYIVVNIPAASLHFYYGAGAALQMKTVVGTPDDRTPRMATHITKISLYPYWNIPRGMMMEEWFDLIKDNRAVLDYHELEIVDSRGNVIPYERINWRSMNKRNFPYRIRQKTGCANPLGVVRFDMSNPFDVYLHDTPGKGAFGGMSRYYSHGCVRVEDAIGLAKAILPGKVDEQYLSACFSDQSPRELPVPEPVPVFIVYMTADADESGNVSYYKDIYGLWEK
jgi:murein L,D-transpeptidase YcbB/YkuD